MKTKQINKTKQIHESNQQNINKNEIRNKERKGRKLSLELIEGT